MKIMSLVAENLIHYALTRGIIYGMKPVVTPASAQDKLSAFSATVTHAPFTLQPYIYPKQAFEQAVELAPLFNTLVDKISRDTVWLSDVLKSTALSDNFTERLLSIMNDLEKTPSFSQPISLGIIRSDYMLHSVDGDSRDILQVEINTIASSFGSLSTKISEMHRSFYPNHHVPSNQALQLIAHSIAAAHHQFLLASSSTSSSTSTDKKGNACTIMVVQPGTTYLPNLLSTRCNLSNLSY